MNLLDIFLIILVTAAFIFCVVWLIRSRKKGRGCCGDCSRCCTSCSASKKNKE